MIIRSTILGWSTRRTAPSPLRRRCVSSWTGRRWTRPAAPTRSAYQQDLARFVAYCAAAEVETLGQVDRVLLRSYKSQLAR